MLLAIDTATRTASLALYDEQGVRGETIWWARENHTVSLMPQLTQLLQVCGVGLEKLTILAVAIGPGSFTGLRIGLSLAKGLALARRLPLVGIPTLDAMAQAFAQQPLPIWALLQAGRGRYAAAPYEVHDGNVERKAEYIIGDAHALAASMQSQGNMAGDSRALVCGELDAPLRSTLAGELGARVVLADPAACLRRAGYLAEIAWRSRQAVPGDLETLAPYYIPTASLPQAMGA